MKKICKRILAVCVAAVILVTLPGVCVLADEFPVEEMIILDMEEDLAEDIMIDNSSVIYDEVSIPEESDADTPTENELAVLTDESMDPVRLHEDQTDVVADDIPLQESQTIEDSDVEELCGAVSHSRDEAVAWANSLVGQQVEYDNVPGAEFQCVDLTKYYYAYLGQPAPSGNANQYVNGGRFTPSGWSYQSSPLPGDIAVWTGGTWGHVAIVTEIRGSQMVCVEQNYNYVSRVTANLHNINAQTYIRPDFPSVVSVNFTPWSNDSYTYIRETDASIGMEINVSGGTCTSEGMYLYDSNGSYLARGSNPTHTNARVFFKINEEMGYTMDRPIGAMNTPL